LAGRTGGHTMTLVKELACCSAYFAVILVGWPLSFVAAVLAHAADWLDDLSYKLLDGWLP